jgi:hypothetical protein
MISIRSHNIYMTSIDSRRYPRQPCHSPLLSWYVISNLLAELKAMLLQLLAFNLFMATQHRADFAAVIPHL